MTEITTRCSDCGKTSAHDEKLAGKTLACPHCSNPIEIPYPPLDLPEERTTGGSVVYRHEPGSWDWDPAIGDAEYIELISNHITEHIGPIESVFHELVSDLVHVDVHYVAPTDDRPFTTLVTSGMSERPMSCPDDAARYRFAELMLCLPPEWPLTSEAFEDEANYWPVRWLKRLARFPHEFDTWLFHGHTIPHGDPPEPLANNNEFTGWIVLPPQLAPEAFQLLQVNDDKMINMLAIFPLYQGEMDLKLDVGTDVLEERFAKNGVTELIDVDRRSVVEDWDF